MPNQLVSESNLLSPERMQQLQEQFPELRQKAEQMSQRCWLYSNKCPEGRIFVGPEVAQALEEGWVDTPTKIKGQGRPKKSEGGSGAGQ